MSLPKWCGNMLPIKDQHGRTQILVQYYMLLLLKLTCTVKRTRMINRQVNPNYPHFKAIILMTTRGRYNYRLLWWDHVWTCLTVWRPCNHHMQLCTFPTRVSVFLLHLSQLIPQIKSTSLLVVKYEPSLYITLTSFLTNAQFSSFTPRLSETQTGEARKLANKTTFIYRDALRKSFTSVFVLKYACFSMYT
jgi:hypothetical protein